MIHVAVMHLSEPSPDGKTELVFASVDGDSYLPINRTPDAGDEEKIAALFEPDGQGFSPMRYARRAMDAWWWPESAAVESFEHYTLDG